MYIAAHIMSVILTGIMSVQDFRSRSISAWLLPLICISLTVTQILQNEWQVIAHNTIVNVVVLLFMYATLTVWFTIRLRRWVRLDDVYIGRGDLLLLLLLTPVFAPFNFMLFFIAGSIAALLVYGLLHLFKPNSERLIPLAGILGVFLILLCVFELFSAGQFRLSNDDIMTMLNPIEN